VVCKAYLGTRKIREPAWERGQNRCARNYAISTAVTWIAGGFTLGIGTAVGSIATAAYFVNCMAETQSDAGKCNSNCEQ
tara:strand:- start:468 stop:704 length:237 start_codon:yes stop_codon:yes gene_type:complete